MGYGDFHDRIRKKERNEEIYRLWLLEEWSLMRLAKHFSLSHWRIQQIIRRESMMKKVLAVAVLFFALAFASAAQAQQGPPSATMHWTAPTVPTPAALTFIVQRSQSQAGPFVAVGSPVSGVTFTDTTVTRGQTYFWQIVSSCPASGAGCGTVASPLNGNSTPSSTVTGTIPNATQTPNTPTNLTLDSVQ